MEDIRGYLLVDIISGRNLPIMDSNGFSDPYVVVTFGNQKFKTKFIRKTLNPRWNERFVLCVQNSDSHEKSILFEAYDHDDAPEDDYMGFVEFKLQTFLDNPIVHNWYRLRCPIGLLPDSEKAELRGKKGVSAPFLSKAVAKRRAEKVNELINIKGEIEFEFSFKSVQQMTQMHPELIITE